MTIDSIVWTQSRRTTAARPGARGRTGCCRRFRAAPERSVAKFADGRRRFWSCTGLSFQDTFFPAMTEGRSVPQLIGRLIASGSFSTGPVGICRVRDRAAWTGRRAGHGVQRWRRTLPGWTLPMGKWSVRRLLLHRNRISVVIGSAWIWGRRPRKAQALTMP